MILQDITNPIVFSAFKTSDSGSFYDGDYLNNYDGFLTHRSDGNSFNLASGIFTSPRKGVFEFSAAITHGNKGFNSLIVEKSGIQVLKFSARADSDSSNDDTLSFSWIMELHQGDTIRLKVTAGRFVASSTYNWIFNGKFIRNI